MTDYKADFHTHSIRSHDGGITFAQYKKILDQNILDYIAITDHNEIDFAVNARKKLGDRIIVGEEIRTKDGEIIGLFLHERIEKSLSIEETVKKIKEQKGLVYIPHPVDRKGVSLLNKKINTIKDKIDIIEVFNAKNLYGRFSKNPGKLQKKFNFSAAVGSDSHSFAEVGRTYNIVNTKITINNLTELLRQGSYKVSYIKLWHMLNPKLNKFKKLING